MNTLEHITAFTVPGEIADVTDEQLRAAGRDRVERFVLWSGVVHAHSFQVLTAHVPRQTAYKGPEGLSVHVEGAELHRLNVWLYEHGEQLAVQVHSHPTDAFHSDLDDTYPMVTVVGGLSIVVPDFGVGGLRGAGIACYRLARDGWDEIPPEAIDQLVWFER